MLFSSSKGGSTSLRLRWSILVIALVMVISGLIFTTRLLVHADGNIYYVASTGLNTNAGTQEQPFQTIQYCADKAQPGDSCIIRGGTYHESVTPARSGSASAPITFKSYQGEQVTVDGADLVTGWSLYKGNIYQAHVKLNPDLFANQVFVDNTMMLDARWPNSATLDPMKPVRATAGVGSSPSNLYDPALTQDTNFWKGATIHFWGTEAYASQSGKVNASSPGTLSFDGGTGACPSLCLNTGDRYYLSGILGALDQPTEWYYDSTAGTLYLWTADGKSPDTHTVEAKQRNNAFDLNGRSYVDVKGLRLFASTVITDDKSSDNLLDGLYARYISHTDNVLQLPGGDGFGFLASHTEDTGIQLKGANNTLSNSDIGISAGSGVVLGGKNQTVTNNLIHDVDYSGTYSSGVSANGDGNKITHNTIYRTGRDAIAGGAPTNASISYNDIFNAQMLNRDSGAMYFCCDSPMTGTVIDHNLVHDTQANYFDTLKMTYGFANAGIYIDNSNYDVTIHHNVVWNAGDAGIFFNDSSDKNTSHQSWVYNNTVAENNSVSLRDSAKEVVKNNIFTETNTQTLASEKHSSNLASETSPKFIDAVHHNYHLQASSPALNKGETIAPYTDGAVGSAPDMGAYESGSTDWTAGSTLDAGIIPIPGVGGYQSKDAGSYNLYWDNVKNATGYKIKYGTTRDLYTTTLDVGTANGYSVGNLNGGQPYYFSVIAYNQNQETPVSTEIMAYPANGSHSATSPIMAGSFDDTSFAVNYKTFITYINGGGDNAWVKYNQVDFGSGVSSFAALVGIPTSTSDGKIEAHLDSTSGPLVGTLTLNSNNGDLWWYDTYNRYQSVVASAGGATGVHNLYLVFKGGGMYGEGLLHLVSFNFSKQADGTPIMPPISAGPLDAPMAPTNDNGSLSSSPIPTLTPTPTSTPTTVSDSTPTPTPTAVSTPTPTPVVPQTSTDFNNKGTSSSRNTRSGNYDGVGYSYPSQLLAAAGLKPGATVTTNGMSFVWPSAGSHSMDNWQVQGQVLPFNQQGQTLGFLGSSTNGPSSGDVTIRYTDGTSQTSRLAFSDWTLNAGKSKRLQGNSVVARLAYRNASNGKQNDAPYVFYSSIKLDASKTVASITLPTTVSQGQLHVFAVAIK